MVAPFPEPAVNEIVADPLPDVADNDVGALGADAENDALQVAVGSEFLQLLSDVPNAFTART
jgi:hypothetical protein